MSPQGHEIAKKTALQIEPDSHKSIKQLPFYRRVSMIKKTPREYGIPPWPCVPEPRLAAARRTGVGRPGGKRVGKFLASVERTSQVMDSQEYPLVKVDRTMENLHVIAG